LQNSHLRRKLTERLIGVFILWARRRAPRRRRMLTFAGDFTLSRFEFLWLDEKATPGGTRPQNRPPWWRPFNMFLHCWRPDHDGEEFHDHSRWSITICLRGRLLERMPQREPRPLTPGSIVFRSHKAIHAFDIPKGHSGKTWTLFIVGRRNHRQSPYRFKQN
jgi:hypothetical protein